MSLKYPTHARNTVENVSLTACIAPRVAVVGANGAGKSTAMKLLISELQPAEGVIWRHQSMRLTYVAQHAFHQLEERQDKTAVEYLLWRFAGADEVNVDDEVSRLAPWFICPKTLDIKKCCQDDTAEAKKERSMVRQPLSARSAPRLRSTSTRSNGTKSQWNATPG